MGLSFLTLALQPVWYFAPLAMLGVGVGFYMLHNTCRPRRRRWCRRRVAPA